MKAPRSMVVSIVLMFGLLVCSSISSIKASDYLGDFCWQTEEGDILKLAINHMGGEHYLLTGRLIETEGLIEAVHGSAEVVGNTIHVTTTSSGGDDLETWTFIGRWLLDRTTLNGTGEIMGVSHDKTDPDPEHAEMDYEKLTLSFVSCP